MKHAFLLSSIVFFSVFSLIGVDRRPAQARESICPTRRDFYCLRYGDRGPRVHVLIEGLRCVGYYNVGNDSWFGPVTDRAVRRFQRDHGITPDGIVGPQTASLIDQKCSSVQTKQPRLPKGTQCNRAISKAKWRISKARATIPLVETQQHGYQDAPAGRSLTYSFGLSGSGSENVMSSPAFLRAISTSIISNCPSMGSVSFFYYKSDVGFTFGRIGNGQVIKFRCLENEEREPMWGEVFCP